MIKKLFLIIIAIIFIAASCNKKSVDNEQNAGIIRYCDSIGWDDEVISDMWNKDGDPRVFFEGNEDFFCGDHLELCKHCSDKPGEQDNKDSFHGYRCTQDCSGHEAGYEWAARKGITDSNDCGGNSQSFIEGCKAYADENN